VKRISVKYAGAMTVLAQGGAMKLTKKGTGIGMVVKTKTEETRQTLVCVAQRKSVCRNGATMENGRWSRMESSKLLTTTIFKGL